MKRKKCKSMKNGILLVSLLFITLITVIILGMYKDKQENVKSIAEEKQYEQKKADELAEKREVNKWYQTKSAFLGDSITEGVDPANNYQVMFQRRYTDLVKKELEFSEVYNYGISGSRITSTDDGNGMIQRYSQINDDVDLIGVFGGTNDFGNDVVIGSLDDGDNTHFKFAFNSLIKGLLDKYHNKKVFVITPIPRFDKYPDKNKQGLALKDYVDTEIDICNKYNVPVLNLYQDYGIDPHNENDKNAYIPDGLHPNDAGHLKLSDKISTFLKTL